MRDHRIRRTGYTPDADRTVPACPMCGVQLSGSCYHEGIDYKAERMPVEESEKLMRENETREFERDLYADMLTETLNALSYLKATTLVILRGQPVRDLDEQCARIEKLLKQGEEEGLIDEGP